MLCDVTYNVKISLPNSNNTGVKYYTLKQHEYMDESHLKEEHEGSDREIGTYHYKLLR